MNWDRAPFNRWSFQHIEEFLPVARIDNGVPAPLPESDLGLDLNACKHGARTAQTILDESYTDGFLLLRSGKIICEHYQNGMQRQSVHLTQSVTKSIIATVVGILHHRGDFPLDRTVADYVPQFAQSAYRGATMHHLLDMTSGVHFPEDVADPVSGIGLMDIAVGWKSVAGDNPNPRSVHELIASLREIARPHGERFEYRSMETEVLGCCIEAAVHAKLPHLVEQLLWQPMGAEYGANFAVDPEGYAIADGGISASLRDLGRFGMIYAQDGYANGRQIVPEEWVRQTRIGDTRKFAEQYRVDRPRGAYRNQFWIDDVTGPVIMALGVYGQMIWIDHQRDFVGVKLSTWPCAISPALRTECKDLMAALADQASL